MAGVESDIWVIEAKWDITYRHSLGRTGSRFFRSLRDEGRILGRSCPRCARVLVPPRSFCDRCFVPTERWVPVGPGGRVEAFTVVYQAFQGLPEPPYCFGYVLLDGASTALLNFIRGLDLAAGRAALTDLRIGARARAVFRPDRTGAMADFHFELDGARR